jgi:hypothetical protein
MNPADLPSGMISRLHVSIVDICVEMDSLLCFIVQARNSTFGDNDIKTRIAHLDRIALFVYYLVSIELIRVVMTYQSHLRIQRAHTSQLCRK